MYFWIVNKTRIASYNCDYYCLGIHMVKPWANWESELDKFNIDTSGKMKRNIFFTNNVNLDLSRVLKTFSMMAWVISEYFLQSIGKCLFIIRAKAMITHFIWLSWSWVKVYTFLRMMPLKALGRTVCHVSCFANP